MMQEFIENFFRQAPGLMFELASAAIILLFGGYFAQTIGAAADGFLARAKIVRAAAGKSKPLKTTIKKKIAGKALKFWILDVFAMMSAKIMGLEVVAGLLGKIALAGVCLFAAVFVYFAAVLAADFWRSRSSRAKTVAGKFAGRIKKASGRFKKKAAGV